jgi:hypothetical protein
VTPSSVNSASGLILLAISGVPVALASRTEPGDPVEPDCILRGMKKAPIAANAGQDGSCLAKFLLSKGLGVQGLIQRSRSFSHGRIDHQYGFSRTTWELGWRAGPRFDGLRTRIDWCANNRPTV